MKATPISQAAPLQTTRQVGCARFAPAGCPGRALAAVVFSMLVGWAPQSAWSAEDVVYVRPRGRAGAEIRLEGEIVHWDRGGIKIRLRPSGIVKEIPADEVARCQLRVVAAQERADKLFDEGKHQEALSSYRAARDQEQRVWLRARIGAQMVWCQRMLDEPVEAAETFLSLAVRDSHSLGFSAIPLKWTQAPTEEAVRVKARAWAEARRDAPAAVLLSASYLLSGADLAESRRKLENLTTHPDQGISGLARAQLWRLEIGQAKGEELRRWRRFVEQMPTDLRGGPYFVIGEACQAAGERVDAAMAFLWLPLVYKNDEQLAAEAGFRAAELLNEAGRTAEAQALYRDLSERFGRTSFGLDARSRLRSSRDSKSGSDRPRLD